jgi:hypothetical protein
MERTKTVNFISFAKRLPIPFTPLRLFPLGKRELLGAFVELFDSGKL